MNKIKVVMMMGIPCCGKSTMINKKLKEFEFSLFVTGSDTLTEIVMKSLDTDYISAYNKVRDAKLGRQSLFHLQNYLEFNRYATEDINVLIDETNVSYHQRMGWVHMLENHCSKYDKELDISVVHLDYKKMGDWHNYYLESRPDKIIPDSAMKRMKDSYNYIDNKESVKYSTIFEPSFNQETGEWNEN